MVTVLAQNTLSDTTLLLSGIIALLAGILILVVPRTLNYIVAFYLVVVGIFQIIAAL